MKYIISVCLIICSFQLYAQKNKTIAIGFYNLENFYDTINDPKKNDDDFTPKGTNAYTPNVFRKKVDNLATVLSMMATDKTTDGLAMVGVAETENEDVLDVLVNHPKLKSRGWKYIIFDGPDERSIDCGLLYNPKYFKLMAATSLTVPVDSGDRPTRDVLYVRGKLQGQEVHVFVNHWPSRRGGELATREKRKLAASVSKKVIDSIMQSNPNAYAIDMGDLNDDPINKSITEVLNAKWHEKDVEPGGLFNPWTSFYKKGLGTTAYSDYWGLFDQIMFSYGFLNKAKTYFRFKEAEVFNQKFMIESFGQYKGYPKRSYSGEVWNDGYSDHFPTIVYFMEKN
jgi:hypothetical protein